MTCPANPIGHLSSDQPPASKALLADKWSINPIMMGTDGTISKKPLNGMLHVTPSTHSSSQALPPPKNGCCSASGSLPEVVKLDAGHVGPPSERVGSPCTEKWLREQFHLNPPVSMRALLTDLREHQEDILNRVLHQQQELQGQMLAMTSAFQATINSHADLRRCQDDRMTELRKLLIARPASKESTQNKPLPKEMSEDEVARDNTNLTSSGDISATIVRPASKESTQNKPLRKETSEAEEKADSAKNTDQVARDNTTLTYNGSIDATGTAGSISATPSSKKSRNVRLTLSHGSNTSELVVHVKARLGVWLTSKQFELGVVCAIIMNSILMCWQSQHQGLELGFDLQYPGGQEKASEIWPGATTVFAVLDLLFDCLFLLEMILKVGCWRLKYFYKGRGNSLMIDSSFVEPESNCPRRWSCAFWHCFRRLHFWNLLDFFCVIAFVVSEISTRAAVGSVDPQLPRLLRCFRLGRLLRLLRYLEFLDHLYIMSTAISALKTVMTGGIALLTMILMTCDLFLVQSLHATYFNNVKAGDLTEEELQKHHEMYRYFGTWTRCILSMFELTLANWPPIARLLTEELSEWFILICLLHKLTIGFAIIGVINGVILQETFKVAQSDDLIMYRQNNRAKNTLRNKLRALFYDLDESGNGSLELEEVERIGDLPEIKIWLSSLGIETDDLTTLFQLLDVSGDGHITCEDFLSRLPRIKGFARSLDVLALRSDLEARPISQPIEYRSQRSGASGLASGKAPNRTTSRSLSLAEILSHAELQEVDEKWAATME